MWYVDDVASETKSFRALEENEREVFFGEIRRSSDYGEVLRSFFFFLFVLTVREVKVEFNLFPPAKGGVVLRLRQLWGMIWKKGN